MAHVRVTSYRVISYRTIRIICDIHGNTTDDDNDKQQVLYSRTKQNGKKPERMCVCVRDNMALSIQMFTRILFLH